MVLTTDIGNSNIVIGCSCDNKILFVERLSTKITATELEYAISFKNVLELYGIRSEDIEGAIISSVVPNITNVIRRAIYKIIHKEAMVVGPGIKTGLKITIDTPAQLGSDLVVDAVAGINEYPLPLIIFDLGTATTVSVVSKEGDYLGGAIMPGMRISMDALVGRTSQLRKISFEPPKNIIGKNTSECIKSGIIYGTASSIDGMIDRINDELGEKATVIATGGLAGTVIPFCRNKIILDDELLLKGLMVIYDKNTH